MTVRDGACEVTTPGECSLDDDGAVIYAPPYQKPGRVFWFQIREWTPAPGTRFLNEERYWPWSDRVPVELEASPRVRGGGGGSSSIIADTGGGGGQKCESTYSTYFAKLRGNECQGHPDIPEIVCETACSGIPSDERPHEDWTCDDTTGHFKSRLHCGS